MTPIIFWLALVCGVDAGYEPGVDGHLEYIIQIEPQLVESLATGHDMASEVPRGLDIRHYRLTIDTAALPHNAIRQASQRTTTTGEASDEAAGAATPQAHVGYQALSAGGVQVVIEIDPSSLGELNEHDLTGDLPPDLPITRFVVSTKAGSAPSEPPESQWENTAEPVVAAMPAVADNAPTVAETGSLPVDQDSSVWHAEDLPATGRAAATQGGPTPALPPASLPATSLPPTSLPLASIPDDNPGGDEPPPAAESPFRQPRTAAPPQSTSGPSGNPPYLEPRDGNFQSGRSGATGSTRTRDNTATSQPVMVDVPGRFSASTTGAPMAESRNGFDNPPSEPRTTRTRKPRDPEPTEEITVDTRTKSATGGHETSESQPAKLWLPLALTLIGLFASLGGNVFLGWVAWDSYNRSRANAAQFDDDKAALTR